MTLVPGARLGSYEIRGAVVAGGMGEAYRAHDPRPGRDRAFEWLDAAVVPRNCWPASSRQPIFDGFRKDPRFAEHLRRINDPDVADPRSGS